MQGSPAPGPAPPPRQPAAPRPCPSPSSFHPASAAGDDGALPPPPRPSGLPVDAPPPPVRKERKARCIMLGHWHQRTWDFAAAMNATGELDCFAAVSDLQDALVVLKAAIEPADVLVCSSYYELSDVQEVLLDYEPVGGPDHELHILVARPNQLNTDGLERVAQWVVDSVRAGLYAPRVKAALLTSSGYMRRLSETSGRSGGSEGT
ncbi:hypothetical protein JCM8208_006088 [Rhodotorula glutinis]